MKAFYEIEQGTEEWHKIRWAKIGGTSSKQLHVKGDTLLNRLVAQALEPYDPTEDGFSSAAMERGNELEPFARKELSEYTGIQFNEVGWIQHDKIDILGMSPDGISEDETVICEIKCPGLENHARYIREGIVPLAYVDQVVMPFAVHEGLERVFFASYRPEFRPKPLFVVEVRKDSLINAGTAARPKKTMVATYALEKRSLALTLREEIKSEINKISF